LDQSTLVARPSTTTHADIDPELRRSLGILDGLIRISVGLEAPKDIIADLEQAFVKAGCRHQSAKEEADVREPEASGTPPSGPTCALESPQSEISEWLVSPLANDDPHEIGIRSEPQG
jgi:hypothetical protein